jgi:hypothetical protein
MPSKASSVTAKKKFFIELPSPSELDVPNKKIAQQTTCRQLKKSLMTINTLEL